MLQAQIKGDIHIFTTAQHIVKTAFDPRQPQTITVCITDHVREQRALRVDARIIIFKA